MAKTINARVSPAALERVSSIAATTGLKHQHIVDLVLRDMDANTVLRLLNEDAARRAQAATSE